MSNLYRVTFVDQQTGERLVWYVLAKNTAQVDEEFADIIKIEYLPYENLTERNHD
jgi:hypothetical protein